MAQERLGSELVGFQPQDHEILSALAVLSTRGVPQDEALFAQGLKPAIEKAPLLLSRFLDGEGLSDSARTSVVKLVEQKFLVNTDGILSVPASLKDKAQSSMKTYFKDLAVEMLKDAAAAAENVWFPAA